MGLDDRSSSSGPPLPGKKPSLPPPPVKKPNRSSSTGLLSSLLSKRDTPMAEQRLADTVDGAGPSRPAQSAPPRGLLEFDSVERSAMLTHPTASRVKAPRRRPPSTVYNKEGVSYEKFKILKKLSKIRFQFYYVKIMFLFVMRNSLIIILSTLAPL